MGMIGKRAFQALESLYRYWATIWEPDLIAPMLRARVYYVEPENRSPEEMADVVRTLQSLEFLPLPCNPCVVMAPFGASGDYSFSLYQGWLPGGEVGVEVAVHGDTLSLPNEDDKLIGQLMAIHPMLYYEAYYANGNYKIVALGRPTLWRISGESTGMPSQIHNDIEWFIRRFSRNGQIQRIASTFGDDPDDARRNLHRCWPEDGGFWGAKEWGEQDVPNPLRFTRACMLLSGFANVVYPCRYAKHVVATYRGETGGRRFRKEHKGAKIHAYLHRDRVYHEFGQTDGSPREAHDRCAHFRFHWKRAGFDRLTDPPKEAWARRRFATINGVPWTWIHATHVGATSKREEGIDYEIRQGSEEMPRLKLPDHRQAG